jgi:hypothetical protein
MKTTKGGRFLAHERGAHELHSMASIQLRERVPEQSLATLTAPRELQASSDPGDIANSATRGPVAPLDAWRFERMELRRYNRT